MNNKNYYIANEETQQQYLDYLNTDVGLLALDTETTSVDMFDCKIMGISLAQSEGEAFYFPIHDFKDGQLIQIDSDRFASLIEGLTKLITNPDTKLIMHNSGFDVWVIRNTLGIDCLPQLYCDTMLLKHTVDEHKPHGLKDIAVKYFGEDSKSEQTDLEQSVLNNGGKWLAKQKDMYMADLKILGTYACADVDLTIKIFEHMSQMLANQGLVDFFYKEEVMPLNAVIVDDLIGSGVKCDIEYFKNLKDQLATEATQFEQEAHQEFINAYPEIYMDLELALLTEKYPLTAGGSLFEEMYIRSGLTPYYNNKGNISITKKVVEQELKDYPKSSLLQWKLGKISNEEFETQEADLIYQGRKELYLKSKEVNYVINLGSNKQLQYILFTKLGETPTFSKKGNAEVDVEVLEEYAIKYTFLSKILQWRKNNKLISTYIDGILEGNKDGVIRPSWLQHGTDSGRLACRNPNFQNLPREDKRIKHGIIARPGNVLIGADYSQLEPRVFSHYSKEQSLIDAFINGDDFYGTLACNMFDYAGNPNTMKEDGAGDLRQLCKTVGLALAYGAQKWKIATVTGKDLKEAAEISDKYWKTYKNLNKFVLQSHGEALTQEFVQTETGRIRRLIGVKAISHSKKFEDKKLLSKLLNLSVNFKIQSTAASVVNRAMINLYQEFKERNLDAFIIMQIHDEIVIECRKEDAEFISQLVKEAMENSYQLSVPLIAEPVIAERLSLTK